MTNIFFYRFRDLCQRNDTTVNAVGRELGISSGALTAWKKGTAPHVSSVMKIADHFGVTIDYLLGVDDTEPMELLSQVDVAWYGEYQELSDEQKDMVRDMVYLMRQRRNKNAECKTQNEE